MRLKSEDLPISDVVEGIEMFESIIDEAFLAESPDEILIRAYFSMIEILKLYTGTGRNAVAFSEFFYFRYVKKYLEEALKISFSIRNVEKGKSKFFSAKYRGIQLILCSDISIKKAEISKRPDIFIGIQKTKDTIYPIAIFEIKLHLEEKDIQNLKERFFNMNQEIMLKFPELKNEGLPLFVWLYLRYGKYENEDFDDLIADFIKVNNYRIMVNEITKWTEKEYESEIIPKGTKINQIMQEIVKKINNSQKI
ncbi:MAG: hypothetical protein ACFFDH_14065 [Promethearchaeota archaeon]